MCAGCTGLILGAIFVTVSMVIFIFIELSIPFNIFFTLIILGFILIASNFLITLITLKNAGGQLLSSLFLIIGFLLIIIGIFQVTGDIIYSLIGVIISFLWLDTRIQLSYWRHTKLCNSCQETCKAYLA